MKTIFFTIGMTLTIMSAHAQAVNNDDNNDKTPFCLFYNEGGKTIFGLFTGIQFQQDADGFTWSTGEEGAEKHNIADVVVPIKLAEEALPPFTSQIDIDSVLAHSHPKANYSWIAEISSDNIIDRHVPHPHPGPYDEELLSYPELYSYDPFDDYLFRFEKAPQWRDRADSPGNVWRDYYISISQMNRVLNSIDEFQKLAGEEEIGTIQAARAEALLQRAYLHFILVNLFAQSYQNDEANQSNTGIPYMTEVCDEVDQNVTALTVAQVYDCIQQDLEDGLSLLASLGDVTSKYRFTPAAAHAFATRFYLFTRQWQKAIDHANAVLGNTEDELRPMMTNYADFENLSYSEDCAAVWQNEENQTNIMLDDTYSQLFRRLTWHRYACGGLAARYAFMYYNTPLYRSWVINPFTFEATKMFTDGIGDAYISSEVEETFEFTDEELGIGIVHTIMRRFTAPELLLERAEARTMAGQLTEARQDLKAYWNCQMDNMSESQREFWISWNGGNGMSYLTDDIINDYFGQPDGTNENMPVNWDFTQNISPDYIVPAEALPLMNCINTFRRWETAHTGMRFFDLKRWGMEYEHTFMPGPTTIRLSSTDARRALQVPWESIYSDPDLLLSTDRLELEPGQADRVMTVSGSSNYQFENSDPEVINVKDFGYYTVTALKPGNATITVKDTSTGQTAQVEVIVSYKDLCLETNSVTLAHKYRIQIISGGHDYSVVSGNDDIVTATISITGDESLTAKKEYVLLTAQTQEGETTVTVTDNNTGQTQDIKVQMKQNEIITVGSVQFTMKRVDSGWESEDLPLYFDHSFFIGQTEVTQALWQTVMGNNPSSSVGGNKPVTDVSWDDCQEFITKLNEMSGRTFRLANTKEWTFAAKGGVLSQGYTYSGSNTLNNVAWNSENSGGTSHDVAQLQPNELGLYDMHGNAEEWCNDGRPSDESTRYTIGGCYGDNRRYNRFNYATRSFSRETANSLIGLRLLME